MYADFQRAINNDLIYENVISQTSNEEIASLRNGDTYSPMFKIILSEASEDPPTKRPPSTLSHSAMGNLSKRLTRELQCKLEDVEEEIRQFREKKYIEFEEFKERAHQDFKIITKYVVFFLSFKAIFIMSNFCLT